MTRCRLRKSPWDREAGFVSPISVWKEMMDIYFPNSAWLCLQRTVPAAL